MKRLALLLLFALPASAQTLQVDLGSSSLFQGTGGGFTFYQPKSTIYAGAGYANGHAVYGFSDTFRRGNTDYTLGDRELGMTFDGTGIGVLERGVAVQTHDLTAFVGATSLGFNVPFLETAGQTHFGAGLFYRRKLGRFELDSLNVFTGGRRTSVQGVNYLGSRLKSSVAAGLFQGTKYLTADTSYSLPSFSATASYQDTLWKTASLGAAWTPRFVNFQGYVLHSKFTGEMLAAGFHIDRIAYQASYFHDGRNSFLSHALMERFWRLILTESYSGKAPTVGIGFSSNRLTFSVTQAVLWTPTGFKQANTVQLSFHIRNASINAGTFVDPVGRIRWTTYGTEYLQTGLASTNSPRLTGYLIEGTVTDPSGKAIEGIAVVIGKETVFSNASGHFACRIKRAATVPLHVNLEDSVTPGKWRVLEVPPNAAPGNAVRIKVQYD